MVGASAGQPVDLLGDDVLVLDRLQRHVDAGHGADLPRPLPGAVHHLVAGDVALVGLHRGDPVAIHLEAGDAHLLVDFRAMHARALGQRLRDVGGAGLAVGRQPRGADEVGRLHQRPHLLDLFGRHQLHVHAEASAPSSPAACTRSSGPGWSPACRQPVIFQPVASPVSASSCL